MLPYSNSFVYRKCHVNKHRKYQQKFPALNIIVNYSIISLFRWQCIMCLDNFINFNPWWWVTPLRLRSKAARFELVPRMCTNYPAPHCRQGQAQLHGKDVWLEFRMSWVYCTCSLYFTHLNFLVKVISHYIKIHCKRPKKVNFLVLDLVAC